MSAATAERTCTDTGLHLIPAQGQSAFRVAKDRHGALSVLPNAVVGPLPVGANPPTGDRRGRFDSVGSTIYLGESRRAAYAEVLVGFRKERAKIAAEAESIGWEVDEYVAKVLAEAQANRVDVPWSIPCDWQMDRSIYEIRLPSDGWWIQIDHAETLVALQHLAPALPGMTERLQLLTSGDVEGGDRDLTTLLAHIIRNLELDDGSEPLGISYQSTTLIGRCWAYWDRRADANLPPGSNSLRQLASENVGPNPDFAWVADLYGLPRLPGHR